MTTSQLTGSAQQAGSYSAIEPMKGAWWKLGSGVLMMFAIYGAFFIAKGASGFGAGGDTARVMFFHVPAAVLSSVCYFVGMFYAVQYLYIETVYRNKPAGYKWTFTAARRTKLSYGTFVAAAVIDLAMLVFSHEHHNAGLASEIIRSLLYGLISAAVVYFLAQYLTWPGNSEIDAKSGISMELGFLFCLLATITGSIFAGIQWGTFWNWDPRETSIIIMLLLYAAYLVLRGAMADKAVARARISAVYAIIALVPAQFLIWAVPRIMESNHPTQVLQNPGNTSPDYKIVLYSAFLAFTLAFVWMFQLRLRAWKLAANREAAL